MPTATKKTAARRPAKKTVVRKPKPKPDHVETKAYIPDPEVAERYVNRRVFGVYDAKIADIAARDGHNMILEGDTGAGKTLFGEAWASARRRYYYSLPCDVSIDPSALLGKMMPTDEVGKFKWVDGPLTSVVRGPCGKGGDCEDPNCWAGALNFSEINFMTPKIAPAIYSLLDRRRYLVLLGNGGEIVRAHKGLLLIADMNPFYRGTVELNAAFYNRFRFKLPWNYDNSVEERLVNFPSLRSLVQEKFRPMHGQELMTPISTNMMMEFEMSALDPDLGIDFAVENFVAAFHTNEKDAVVRAFEMEKVNIQKDVDHFIKEARRKARRGDIEEDDLEEIDMEFEEDED